MIKFTVKSHLRNPTCMFWLLVKGLPELQGAISWVVCPPFSFCVCEADLHSHSVSVRQQVQQWLLDYAPQCRLLKNCHQLLDSYPTFFPEEAEGTHSQVCGTHGKECGGRRNWVLQKRLGLEGRKKQQVYWRQRVCGEQRGSQGSRNVLITKICAKWFHTVFQIP